MTLVWTVQQATMQNKYISKVNPINNIYVNYVEKKLNLILIQFNSWEIWLFNLLKLLLQKNKNIGKILFSIELNNKEPIIENMMEITNSRIFNHKKKLHIIASNMVNKKWHIIVLIVGKTFVLNVPFMVNIWLIYLGNHKEHSVKMIKKAIG